MSPNHIRRAIDSLYELRVDLAKQLHEVNQAIAALQPLVPRMVAAPPVPLPDAAEQPSPPPVPARANQPADSASPVVDLTARLMQALSDLGPSSGVALAEHVKAPIERVRETLQRLAKTGIVHSQGGARWLRWHLGAKGASRQKPAKEAPSRS